jgi:hypothetical protein
MRDAESACEGVPRVPVRDAESACEGVPRVPVKRRLWCLRSHLLDSANSNLRCPVLPMLANGLTPRFSRGECTEFGQD